MRKTIPWAVFLGLLLFAWQVQAQLSAHLDRDRITDGDTVLLQIEAGAQVSGRPDTAPLQKDFDVLGVSSGSRVSIVNGHMDARATWTITLRPKRTGEVIVPPLRFGAEQTPPLSLQVGALPVASEAGGAPVFIETEVDPADPYVEQLLIYTVRVFQRIKLGDGNLGDPVFENAMVRRLGKENRYQVQRDGQRYQVLERRYAILPQAVGELHIPGPILDVEVPEQRPRRKPRGGFFDDDLFFDSPLDRMFAPKQRIRVRGPEQRVRVQAPPEAFTGTHWLPAEALWLEEEWSPPAGEIRVGEPITRSLVLRARGLSGGQLPDLVPGEVPGFRVYPDKARSETRELSATVEGSKTLSIAFIPTQTGRLDLPPVQLRWWDLKAGRERIAELPGRSVQVMPGLAGDEPLPAQDPLQHAPAAVPQDAGAGPAAFARGVQVGGVNPWIWVSLLFGLLWLLTLWFWWRRPARGERVLPDPVAHPSSPPSVSESAAREAFHAACHANDPVAARRELLAWAAAHWPKDPPRGLNELARRVQDEELETELLALDQVVFGDRELPWAGAALARMLPALPSPSAAKTSDSDALPDLYPGS